MGLRLRDAPSERLSWLDIRTIIRQAPRGSAIRRVLDPEGWDWGVAEHLLASATDALRSANWQRGGGKGSKPKRVRRPNAQDKQTKTYGFKPMPIAELNKVLGWTDRPEVRRVQ